MRKIPEITWGSFIPANIIRSILKDCIESGDPEAFFRALAEQVEWIQDELYDTGLDDWDGALERLYEQVTSN